MVLTLEYGFIWCEITFVFPSLWSSVFGPNFPQITIKLQIPNNRSNLILRWFCQLGKASFYVNHGVGDFGLLFMCPTSWLPSFLKLPKCPKYPKTDIAPPSDSCVPGLRPHLMWNIDLKVLDYFASVLAYGVRYFDLVSLNCAYVPNNLKQI